MPVLPDRVAGAWSPMFEVIKLSHVRLGVRSICMPRVGRLGLTLEADLDDELRTWL
jgi:hypothetical protein